MDTEQDIELFEASKQSSNAFPLDSSNDDDKGIFEASKSSTSNQGNRTQCIQLIGQNTESKCN